jgi:hypothetical protein
MRSHRHANASGTPAAPTSSLAERRCRAVAASAPPQYAPFRRLRASWYVRPYWRAGVRSAAGPQRQERPRQVATLSRAGHPALRTRTSQAHCNRWSHGRPPVLCTLHANACTHIPDLKVSTYPLCVSRLRLTSFVASTSAPTFKRTCTMLRCPSWLAQCRAVIPSAEGSGLGPMDPDSDRDRDGPARRGRSGARAWARGTPLAPPRHPAGRPGTGSTPPTP